MMFEAGRRIVVIGDSITDCGRVHPDLPGHAVIAGAFLRVLTG